MDIKTKTYRTNYDLILAAYKRAELITDINKTNAIEIHSLDETNNKINFYYYEDFSTLRKWVNSIILKFSFNSRKEELEYVFNSIGEFIACFHNLPIDNQAKTLRLKLEKNSNEVGMCRFLHSDLTDNNIIINKDNEIIIIDWEPTPIVGSYFNYGSIYWDLTWFANAVLRPSPGTILNNQQRVKLVLFFLESYQTHNKINIKLFFEYYKNFVYKLIELIYKKSNLSNKILLNQHYKNWRLLEKSMS